MTFDLLVKYLLCVTRAERWSVFKAIEWNGFFLVQNTIALGSMVFNAFASAEPSPLNVFSCPKQLNR